MLRSNGLRKAKYKYEAYIEVRMTSNNPRKFIIERWLPVNNNKAIKIKHKKKYFNKKDYNECNNNSYQDITD